MKNIIVNDLVKWIVCECKLSDVIVCPVKTTMEGNKSSVESSESEIEDLSDELVNPRLTQELRAEAETQLIEETESIVRRLKEESR